MKAFTVDTFYVFKYDNISAKFIYVYTYSFSPEMEKKLSPLTTAAAAAAAAIGLYAVRGIAKHTQNQSNLYSNSTGY